ncbi:MAG: zinc ribbon domain-containing protein [Clostridiales bacterium]|nr:zinc ribbon domain-containing protein [Clostridiales bacterium]
MTCQKCGCQNLDTDEYCVQCGSKLNRMHSKNRILYSIIALLCITVLTLVVLLLLPESEQDRAPTVAFEVQEQTITPIETETRKETDAVKATTAETKYTEPTVPAGYISSVDGDWESVTLHDGYSSLNVYAFAFSQELKQCREMTISMEVSMNAGTSCKDWQAWGRIGGKFQKIAKMDLPAGDGFTSQTIQFDSPITLDAIIVTPTVPGGYSWSMSLLVTDVWLAE